MESRHIQPKTNKKPTAKARNTKKESRKEEERERGERRETTQRRRQRHDRREDQEEEEEKEEEEEEEEEEEKEEKKRDGNHRSSDTKTNLWKLLDDAVVGSPLATWKHPLRLHRHLQIEPETTGRQRRLSSMR